MGLCLVTGACGFVGTYMCELLAQKGFKVRGTDRAGLDTTNLSSLGVEFVPADLTQKETLKPAVSGVEYVFHPAAVFDYSAPWELLERVNVGGTTNLCEVMAEAGAIKRFVNWSTVGVYGTPRKELLPYTENSPVVPGNLYEKSKKKQEEVVEAFYQKHKLPYTTIRPTPIYGPRNLYGVAQMVLTPALLHAIVIPKNFTFRMPFAHVKDICGAAFHLSQKPEAAGQIYNVADDSRLTNYEFMSFLGDMYQKKVIAFPYFPASHARFWMMVISWFMAKWSKYVSHKRPLLELETSRYIGVDYVFSNEKLKGTGYTLLYPDVRKGMAETIRWYYENGILPKNVVPKEAKAAA